jgi:opacity protein-like surface antigen
MKKKLRLIIINVLIGFSIIPAFSQDDLMDMFTNEEPVTDYTYATFKTTRISLGQSIENPAAGNLIFDIQHHFGRLNEGAYEFFGLDQATLRLGFQYGITPWLSVGYGRSTLEKTYDGSVKVKIIRQSSGAISMPVSISYFGSIAINSLKFSDASRTNYFSSRLSYANQLLIARKFNSAISLQLSPTFIHRNLVEEKIDDNDVWALGAGGRFKLSNRVSLNLEYYYIISKQTSEDFHDSFTVGFDIETGGHVFQLFFTNSQGIVEQHFIPRTTGDWLLGDIHFGFNISRTFVLKKPKEFVK